MSKPIPEIVAKFYLHRAQASTAEERRRVWRFTAIALLETFRERAEIDPEGCAGFVMNWRRSESDSELPIRYAPYWRSLPLDDLKALWYVLENAKHK